MTPINPGLPTEQKTLFGVPMSFLSLRRIFVIFCCLSVLIPFLQPVSVSAAPDPTEQFRPFIDRVTSLLADPELKKLSKKEQCQKMIGVVRERFDFREMSKRVLGRHWRSLSGADQEQFEELFTQLLQYAYVGKIDEYSGQKVKFTQQRIRGDRAEVQTQLVERNRTIPVSYILQLQGDQWMAYDVVVEGVSLIRNYMEQFQQIIGRDGYATLVEQIKNKINQLEQQYRQT